VSGRRRRGGVGLRFKSIYIPVDKSGFGVYIGCMSQKRGGLVAVAQGWGALVDGHASKCPLCGQTTSQRDIAHLPSRTGRDYRQIGRDKLQPEVAGREAKSVYPPKSTEIRP